MKNSLFLMVFGLLGGLVGCGQPTVRDQPIAQPFPTQMTFKGSVFKVQKAIHQIFKNDSQKIFNYPANFPPTFSLYWKGDHHPEEVKIFKNPVNENDVYISCDRNPICKSTVYLNWRGKALEYLADFQLHIIPQGAKETLVKVITINPQVLAGKTLVNVQPTTIEENEILQAIKASESSGKNR